METIPALPVTFLTDASAGIGPEKPTYQKMNKDQPVYMNA